MHPRPQQAKMSEKDFVDTQKNYEWRPKTTSSDVGSQIHAAIKLLTHAERDTRTSDNIAFANFADPSSPRSEFSRVLLFPGIGHLATTAIAWFS